MSISVELTRKPDPTPSSGTSPSRAVSVALVNMPFGSVVRPSIQVGLLHAIAATRGHAPQALHLNVDFAIALRDEFGDLATELYEGVSSQRYATGDWFFAAEAFGAEAPDPSELLDVLCTNGGADRSGMTEERYRNSLLRIRTQIVPAFLDAVMEALDWGSFEVIGFTSTFQQNVSSFALARRLRAAHPNLVLLFGGANFDGDMGPGWVRDLSFIDYAISGEADASFPDFLDAIAAGTDPLVVPGVIGRRNGVVVMTPPEPFEALDTNPPPNYSDYYARIAYLGAFDRHEILIPFESARGCWWGQKSHCTFCGLNGGTMRFRAKSPERVLSELTHLALTYRGLKFAAVDNIIDTRYYGSLLPGLVDRNRPFSMFYETKADLSREQVELFVRSGIDSIQPGIESLSSRMLGLMRKGTRAAWNVNVLRWCAYYGIHVSWNVLWGFPGEKPEDTEEQVLAFRLLSHLQPAGGGGRLWMERFSPLFRDAAKVTHGLRPHFSYRFTYPVSVDLSDTAYFFDYELIDGLPDSHYEPVALELAEWQRLAATDDPPSMLVDDTGDRLVIADRRDPSAPRTFVLRGLAMAVHRACMDLGLTPEQIAVRTGFSLADVVAELDGLVADGLLFRDRRLHLALALPAAPPAVRGRLLPTPSWWTTEVGGIAVA